MKTLARAICCAIVIGCQTFDFATACPYCPSNLEPPLAQQVREAEVALFVKQLSTKPANVETGFAGETVYVVEDAIRNATEQKFAKGERVTFKRPRVSPNGSTFLLLGRVDTEVRWADPTPITSDAVAYVRNAPASDAPTPERLAYYLEYLEHEDTRISNDAFAEFAVAQYDDVAAAVKGRLSPERVRGWLADPQVEITRIGFYGLLLGLVGTDADRAYLHDEVVKSPDEFRLGIDGMIGGYLLLAGAEGLDVIDRTKLANDDAAFSEIYAAAQSLRFLWSYVPDRIEKDRLRASMRLLLKRPDMADLVITDLARWQDWEVADRLMEMYSADEFDLPTIKRAIVRFYLVADHIEPDKEGAPSAEQRRQIEAHLAQLRKDDPDTVKKAERFFFLN